MQSGNTWKFSTPQLHNILHRQKLIDLLESRPERKIIVVHAKAGQGKTTFMADYLRSGNYPSAWIRLTAEDSDPGVFLKKLDDGLQTLQDGASESADTNRDTKQLADSIIGEFHKIRKPGTHLVLDDFDTIADSRSACTIVEKIIENLPESVRLVILSRQQPCLSLGRVRLLQNMTEIRDRDLALSDVEAVELLHNVYPLDISRDMVIGINRRTDGWVTGIVFLLEQMSLLESGEMESSAITEFISGKLSRDFHSFFEDEIFGSAAAAESHPLVSFGPFSEIPTDLAIEILGADADSLLHEASGNGFFISKSEPGSDLWVFNPIFADYLSMLFDRLPKAARESLLRKASKYYTEAGDREKVLFSLIRGEWFQEAKDIFVTYAENLIRSNKYLRIEKLLSMFPDDIKKNDQYLIFYSLISDNLYHPHATKKKLLDLLPFFKEKGDADRQATIYSVLLQNYFFYQETKETLSSIACMARDFLNKPGGELHSDKKRLLEALLPLGEDWTGSPDDDTFDAAMRAEETSLSLHDNDAFLCSRLVLARKYIHRGDFHAAKNLLKKTLEFFTGDRRGKPYVSLISFYLGDILFYTGDIHAAIRLVQDGLDDASPDFAFRPYLDLNLILYNLYLSKFQNAEALYNTIDDQKMGENLYLRYYRVYFLQMLIAYRNGNRRRASYYCKRLLEPENEILLNTDYPYSRISLLEVGIWLEEKELTEELLHSLEDELTPEFNPYSLATFYALKALYLQRNNRSDEAGEAIGCSAKILEENIFTNLDICNPELLYTISRMFDGEPTELFPRLKPLATSNQLKDSTAQLEIVTLGRFQIFAKGKEIPINSLISQKRVMDLMKLLIIFRKNGVVKEMVYEPFWPKYSLKNARDNLNTIFYRLRNILGKDNDFFIANSTTICFRDGVLDTDVDRFLQFIRFGEESESRNEFGNAIDMYRHAVDLYGGDFLSGDLYSDFIRDERHILERKYIHTLFKLAKLYLAAGDYLQALDCLKTLLDKDPVCEPAVRLLMVGSALVGSRNSIPQLLNELSGKLAETYGLEPDEITTRLKDELLSGKRPEPSMWNNEVIVS